MGQSDRRSSAATGSHEREQESQARKRMTHSRVVRFVQHLTTSPAAAAAAAAPAAAPPPAPPAAPPGPTWAPAPAPAPAAFDAADDDGDPPTARTVKHALLTQEEWQHYSMHGFVNIGGILSDDLLQRLTQAALRIRERVRDGSLYHGFIHRTGIAAPGFPCGPRGGLGEPWLARGIFSPQHGEPVFGEYLSHPRLMRYCADFLGCTSTDQLLLCDTSLLISPRDADFSVGWHFDYHELHQETTQPITAEQWRTSKHTPARRGILQFNCTLDGDNMFELLPGSHRRPLNADERASLWQDRGGSVPAGTAPADWTPPLPGNSGATVPICEPGVFTFWDGGILHHARIKRADTSERLQLHNLMRAPMSSDHFGNWNVLPGSQSSQGRHMNPQDYWVAAPSVRENLPRGYAQAAWDRWFSQLGGLPPEIAGRNPVGGDILEQYDYAEAALYWGELRPPHSSRYHPA